MSRIRKGVIGTVLASLIAMTVGSPPASALTAAAIEFTVHLSTPPLGVVGAYPANIGRAHFSSYVCLGGIAGKATSAGPCGIAGSGTLVGNCDLWSATMWGTLVIEDAVSATWQYVSFHVTLDSVEGKVVGSGSTSMGGQTGIIAIQGWLAPVYSPWGSCLTGYQTDFTMLGTAVVSTV